MGNKGFKSVLDNPLLASTTLPCLLVKYSDNRISNNQVIFCSPHGRLHRQRREGGTRCPLARRSKRRRLNALLQQPRFAAGCLRLGRFLCHRSEPDWHFHEKPIHLHRSRGWNAFSSMCRQNWHSRHSRITVAGAAGSGAAAASGEASVLLVA